MYKKFQNMMMILALFSMVLSACSSPASVEPAVSEPAALEPEPALSEPEPVVSEPEPIVESPAVEPVTLRYWAMVPTQSQFDILYERFQELHPEIKIEFQHFQDGSEYAQKLRTSLLADEGPDMFMVFSNEVDRYEGFVEDINPLARERWGEDWVDYYIPIAIPGSTASNGKVIGVPTGVESMEYILYNKTMWDEMGITGTPQTYEELKEIVATIKENGAIPIVLGAKDKWHIIRIFIYLANQFGPGNIYQAEAGEISWSDPALVDTMKAWKQMFDDGIFQDGAVGLASYPDARDQYYYARKATMFPTGSWHVGSYALPPGGEKFGTPIENDETGAFLFPQIGPYPAVATASLAWIFTLNAASENKDAAWTFFEFVVRGEGAQMMADSLQVSPVIKGMQINTLDQLPFQSDRDSMNMLIDALANAQGSLQFIYPELQEAVGTAMQEVAIGSKSPEEAMEDIQAVSDMIER